MLLTACRIPRLSVSKWILVSVEGVTMVRKFVSISESALKSIWVICPFSSLTSPFGRTVERCLRCVRASLQSF